MTKDIGSNPVGRRSLIHDIRANWKGRGSIEQVLDQLAYGWPEARAEILEKSGVDISEDTLRRWTAKWAEKNK